MVALHSRQPYIHPSIRTSCEAGLGTLTTLPRKMVLPAAKVQVIPTTLAPKFLMAR